MICTICNYRVIYDKKISSRFDFSAIKDYFPKIVRCTNCGLRSLSPMPSASQYKKVYSRDYFLGEEKKSGFSDGVRYENTINERNLGYRKKLESIVKLNNNINTILDIGAAQGDFVSVARLLGFSASGIECNPDSIEYAKTAYNIDLDLGFAEDIDKYEESFDLLVMNHVFEHLTNPSDYLRIAQKHMHQDSILHIEIPYQFDNLREKIRSWLRFPKKYKGLLAVHHPIFYSKKSIKLLLSKEGFDVVTFTTNPSYNRGRNKIKNMLFYPLEKIFDIGTVIEINCKLRSG
jgi:trans-aconitate methyltransferase